MCSNIEDVARDAGSINVEEDVLLRKHNPVVILLEFSPEK